MAEYIERSEAIEAFDNPDVERNYGDVVPESVIRVIEQIPAAEVRPVVRGKWEYNPGDNIPYCSECMMPQDSECNFCPNCGADMREES